MHKNRHFLPRENVAFLKKSLPWGVGGNCQNKFCFRRTKMEFVEHFRSPLPQLLGSSPDHSQGPETLCESWCLTALPGGLRRLWGAGPARLLVCPPSRIPTESTGSHRKFRFCQISIFQWQMAPSETLAPAGVVMHGGGERCEQHVCVFVCLWNLSVYGKEHLSVTCVYLCSLCVSLSAWPVCTRIVQCEWFVWGGGCTDVYSVCDELWHACVHLCLYHFHVLCVCMYTVKCAQ